MPRVEKATLEKKLIDSESEERATVTRVTVRRGLEEKRIFFGENSTKGLSELKPGEQGVVVAVEGGRGLRQKLSLRGISAGSVVRMIWASRGPIVVDVDRSTVCMGRGMAQKVRIRRI